MGRHVSFDPPTPLSAAQRAHETPNRPSVLAANLSVYHGGGCPRRILEFCGCSDRWAKCRLFLHVSLGASFVVLKFSTTMIAFLPYYIATNPTLTRYHTLCVGSRERAVSPDSLARVLRLRFRTGRKACGQLPTSLLALGNRCSPVCCFLYPR